MDMLPIEKLGLTLQASSDLVSKWILHYTRDAPRQAPSEDDQSRLFLWPAKGMGAPGPGDAIKLVIDGKFLVIATGDLGPMLPVVEFELITLAADQVEISVGYRHPLAQPYVAGLLKEMTARWKVVSSSLPESQFRWRQFLGDAVPEPKPKLSKRSTLAWLKHWWPLVVVVGVLAGILGDCSEFLDNVVPRLAPLLQQELAPTPTPTVRLTTFQSPASTQPPSPTTTMHLEQTSTATPTDAPSSTPTAPPPTGTAIHQATALSPQPAPTPLSFAIPAMILVPEGPFPMGGDPDEPSFCPDEDCRMRVLDELPRHSITLGAYSIGKYEVTNLEYAEFVDNAGHPPPDHWEGGKVPGDKANYPVANVSWTDAVEYCAWLAKATGVLFRLPTEAEWEKAASWEPVTGTKRRYPWGNKFYRTRCNTSGQAAAVGSYPDCESAYGAIDMAGNVWEWTADQYDAYPGALFTNSLEGKGWKVTRGCSYNGADTDCRCTYRGRLPPDAKQPVYGFRVASDPSRIEQAR